MRGSRSSRPAGRGMPRPTTGFAGISCRTAIRSIGPKPIGDSAAAIRTSRPSSTRAAWPPLSPLRPLIIDAHVADVRGALARRRAVVLSASPGAGKTTRIPPALVDAGPVILLQPRRVAARAVARRIAGERAWTLGREVGWQIRFEKRFTRDTRLLVVTDGILTARLQQDPLLSDFTTIIL